MARGSKLVDSYESKRAAEKEALILQLARNQRAERGRFTKAYENYLTSDAWKAKRGLVLQRCGGICEGCGVAKATEVHHTTYEHLYNEFLFELLGLCHPCHDRITHERRAAMGIEDDDGQDDEVWNETDFAVNDEDVPFHPTATYLPVQ